MYKNTRNSKCLKVNIFFYLNLDRKLCPNCIDEIIKSKGPVTISQAPYTNYQNQELKKELPNDKLQEMLEIRWFHLALIKKQSAINNLEDY